MSAISVYLKGIHAEAMVRSYAFDKSKIYFAPFRHLKYALVTGDWPAAGRAFAKIRRLTGTNLILGLTVVAVTSGGRYLA